MRMKRYKEQRRGDKRLMLNRALKIKINTDVEQWPQSVSALSEKINRRLVKFTSMSPGFAQTFCSWHLAKREIKTSGSQSVAAVITKSALKTSSPSGGWIQQGWTISFRNRTKLKNSIYTSNFTPEDGCCCLTIVFNHANVCYVDFSDLLGFK